MVGTTVGVTCDPMPWLQFNQTERINTPNQKKQQKPINLPISHIKILHSIVVGVTLAHAPRVCCAQAHKCMVIVEQSHPIGHPYFLCICFLQHVASTISSPLSTLPPFHNELPLSILTSL